MHDEPFPPHTPHPSTFFAEPMRKSQPTRYSGNEIKKEKKKEKRNEEDLLVEKAMRYTRTSTTLHLPLHNSTNMKMVSIAANAERPLVAIALRSHSIPIQSVARNRIYSIESIHYHVLLSVICTHWFHSYTSIQSLHSPMN